MIRLSVLILTHKRPELFKRCLKSALHEEVEIIVNNDSRDILEIYSEKCKIKYFYQQGSLTSKYEFLTSQAKTDYVYFLEDDDVLLPSFFKVLENLDSEDCYVGKYICCDNDLPFSKRILNFSLGEYFQLSQCVFKKKSLNFKNLVECKDKSCIFNDYYLFKNSVKTFKKTNILFFKQTLDAKDNISFPEFSDLRNCSKCSFKYF